MLDNSKTVVDNNLKIVVKNYKFRWTPHAKRCNFLQVTDFYGLLTANST